MCMYTYVILPGRSQTYRSSVMGSREGTTTKGLSSRGDAAVRSCVRSSKPPSKRRRKNIRGWYYYSPSLENPSPLFCAATKYLELRQLPTFRPKLLLYRSTAPIPIRPLYPLLSAPPSHMRSSESYKPLSPKRQPFTVARFPPSTSIPL